MTAEFVAKKYNISREAQDAYALSRSSAPPQAQQAGRFDAEIVPFTTMMAVTGQGHRGGQPTSEVTLSRDEGNRADTTLDSLPLRSSPVIEGGSASRPAMPASCPTAPAPAW
jgi:acetyl-CoA C-acetyltransferase